MICFICLFVYPLSSPRYLTYLKGVMGVTVGGGGVMGVTVGWFTVSLVKIRVKLSP